MRRIGDKITITFGLLIFSAIFVCAWYLYSQTRHHLEKELGQRLVDIAQTIAHQLNGEIIRHLVPGNERGVTYHNLVRQLNQVRENTAVSRIYIFDKNHCSLVDTQASVPIGTEYLNLTFDQLEMEYVWQKKGVSSVLFLGEDGRYYKSGYAPIVVGGEVVAALGVDASAAFLHIMRRFRRSVVSFGIVCILMSVVIGFILSKTITNPIHQLVASIEKISQGNLNAKITVNSNDEIGFLGRTMEQMRSNIIQRDAQMKLMLANVAHEIRNPLSGIELFAGILSEELGHSADAHSARQHLDKIIREVRKLNQIITEFLDFARSKKPQKQEVSLEELIQSAYFMLALEFEEARISFTSQVEPLLKIQVDPEQFKRVFINLFKNSLQALRSGKTEDARVSVRSRYEESMVEIIVEDNGPGISQEALQKLFEPFYTTKEKGAGLGLAIVRKIIADHGERIEVLSVQGQFTRVIIQLLHPIKA
ncbi:MAG: ATP-binding protein [bacterium]